MIVDESIEICERTVASLREADKDYDKHPAIVVAPSWWVEKVKLYHGVAGTDLEIDSFCQCKLLVQDVPGPEVVAGDGRRWSLLPAWLRADKAKETP